MLHKRFQEVVGLIVSRAGLLLKHCKSEAVGLKMFAVMCVDNVKSILCYWKS